MPTYKCTNCNEYKRSKYEAGCYGSCGKRDCKECCESCGNHTLISMEVANISSEIGISVSNPVLRLIQQQINEVDNGVRNQFTVVIDQRTVSGYWGPPTSYTYTRGGTITRDRILH
jgi:hypothetical protein